MNRRDVLWMTLCALAAGAGPARAADQPLVEVWKTPTCGCCRAWVKHLEDAGFRVQVTSLDDVGPIKKQFGVPPALSSCHTARVGGYVVEGHVPAQDIVRLLRQKPKIQGIYLPGMPAGSPGMEGPHGERYDVLALDESGKTSVFATHQP
jgi:hypothetical protein